MKHAIVTVAGSASYSKGKDGLGEWLVIFLSRDSGSHIESNSHHTLNLDPGHTLSLDLHDAEP